MNVTRRWRQVLLGLIVFSATFAGLARVASAAEASRFLVSYGGTAGYQLPLWVNKELGFSKKHGVDLEIILIQAGLAEYPSAAWRQPAVDSNGGLVGGNRRDSGCAGGNRCDLGK